MKLMVRALFLFLTLWIPRGPMQQQAKEEGVLLAFDGTRIGYSGLAFSPDAQKVAFVVTPLHHSSAVELFDLTTRRKIRFFGARTYICSLCFSPDGQFVIVGSCSKTADLWNVSTGRLVRRFPGHETGVAAVAFASHQP